SNSCCTKFLIEDVSSWFGITNEYLNALISNILYNQPYVCEWSMRYATDEYDTMTSLAMRVRSASSRSWGLKLSEVVNDKARQNKEPSDLEERYGKELLGEAVHDNEWYDKGLHDNQLLEAVAYDEELPVEEVHDTELLEQCKELPSE
ncbi:unnamed protein product, partial [Prorocentrum cordatum]